ncbi:hypothetical protein [Rhizobium leguminosarum]
MSFYSNSSSQRLDDTLEAMRLVMPDVLEREREVANKKWFAYRFMTPLAATKHFASLYSKGFKAYIRFNGDRDEAELRQAKSVRKDTLFSPAKMRSRYSALASDKPSTVDLE